ncbi:hypothetical protein [Hansschlegelia zhihuaiae]|uniref:Uncharacterized protein n=1 Tax=Hansschlegelia zhihuaiae TaxID=405005 RepID=A0A4Q0MP08_9HYPH|nr:hypothetical protein [Hansschlegelia zhihuaiae]RXF75383.1 hypothetical protein EK403_00520 [Hansschlegelia zhihuaiae]
MVEPILYASLGALLAALAGLLFLPVFWRRAVRLTTKRLIDRLPISAGEIVAAQDRLRAEHAMTMRQVERKAERTMGDATRDRVESARARSTELGHLADIADLRSQIDLLVAEGARMRGERDKSGEEAAAAYDALKEARAAADAAARDLQAARPDASAARRATEQARVESSAREAEIRALRDRLAAVSGQQPAARQAQTSSARADGKSPAARPHLPRAETPFGGSADEPPLAASPQPAAAVTAPLPAAAELAELRKRLDEVADAIVEAAETEEPSRGRGLSEPAALPEPLRVAERAGA